MAKTYVAMEKTYHQNDDTKYKVQLIASSSNECNLLEAMLERVKSLGMHPEVTMKGEKWNISYHEPYDPLIHNIVIEAVEQI